MTIYTLYRRAVVLLALLSLLAVVMVAFQASAFAADGTGSEPVTLNLAGLIGIFLNFVAPILVGALTKMSTHPAIKAVGLLALAALTGVLTQAYAAGGDGFPWAQAFLTAGLSFAVAVATHFGLLKPTGITRLVQDKIGPKDAPIPTDTVGVAKEEPNTGT